MLENILVIAACLLVLEGIVPSIAPRLWRQKMLDFIRLEDGQVRGVGVGLVLVGILLLWIAQQL